MRIRQLVLWLKFWLKLSWLVKLCPCMYHSLQYNNMYLFIINGFIKKNIIISDAQWTCLTNFQLWNQLVNAHSTFFYYNCNQVDGRVLIILQYINRVFKIKTVYNPTEDETTRVWKRQNHTEDMMVQKKK